MQRPSLALLEATTWTKVKPDTGHCSLEELVDSGFLKGLDLQRAPEQERYGAYLVHYSGWEDPWRALTDDQLKARFDKTFPAHAQTVSVAKRGQEWIFSL